MSVGDSVTSTSTAGIAADGVDEATAARFARAMAPLVDAGAVIADDSDLPHSVSWLELNDPRIADDPGAVRSVTVEQAIEKERAVYGVNRPAPRDPCAEHGGDDNAIVVCGKQPVDSARFRVKSTAELDPGSREALDDGWLRAPNVGPPPCTSVCIRMGAQPPQLHLIDLSKIPEAPPGSDADRIARGEMAAP
mgnify:CR=1 FL=1